MKNKKGKRSLPRLAAALFVERIVRENDDVVTLVRVVDVLTFNLPEIHDVDLKTDISAFISFKSAGVRGTRELEIVATNPKGERSKKGAVTKVKFEGGEKGVQVLATISTSVRIPGLYYFDVLLDGHQMARMPLTVILQKSAATSESDAKEGQNKKQK